MTWFWIIILTLNWWDINQPECHWYLIKCIVFCFDTECNLLFYCLEGLQYISLEIDLENITFLIQVIWYTMKQSRRSELMRWFDQGLFRSPSLTMGMYVDYFCYDRLKAISHGCGWPTCQLDIVQTLLSHSALFASIIVLESLSQWSFQTI